MKHVIEHLFFGYIKEICKWVGIDFDNWIIMPFGVLVVTIYLLFGFYFTYKYIRNIIHKRNYKMEQKDVSKVELGEHKQEKNEKTENECVSNMSLENAIQLFEKHLEVLKI